MFICFFKLTDNIVSIGLLIKQSSEILEFGERLNILSVYDMVNPKLGISHMYYYLNLHVWYCDFHFTDF